MTSITVCEYSRSRSFHDDFILQDQASGERSQDQWSSGFIVQTSFSLRTKILCISGVPVNDLAPMKNCPGGRDFTTSLTPQCWAFSGALKIEKLKAPLFIDPIGAGIHMTGA